MTRHIIATLILSMACSIAFANDGENKMLTANEVIKKLDLKPLPEEGGYFRETYRCTTVFNSGDGSPRALSTAIYYLVVPESFSALHRIKSDEIFHFYAGNAVEMIQIDPSGKLSRLILGSDIANGESPQIVVPAGTWQALKLKQGGQWALMGTTVAPGFEFEDFELGNREEMILEFPQLSNNINSFTRGPNESVR